MDFSVGETLRIDGELYDIIGKIKYKNLNDHCCWFEYRMTLRGTTRVKWLSIDTKYNEYSISEVVEKAFTSAYHRVDSGIEEVVGVWGSVDVEVGDRASFTEYEDRTEEEIISSEIWDDGEELSVGYYLDLDEISIHSDDSSYGDGGFGGGTYRSGGSYSNSFFKNISFDGSTIIGIGVFIYILIQILPMFDWSSNNIAKYLEKSSSYTYVTSITGNEKQKADVYRSHLTDLDTTAKDILSAIDGDTENVQQNTEDGDNSIAIMTDKEYCLVYISEDNEVLVQVSSRKYAYTTDSSPYRSRYSTHRYYRRYYYSKGYIWDASDFGNYTSPYSSFDDTMVDSNYNDTYDSYSSSVRQASINSRLSSGGGLSSGK